MSRNGFSLLELLVVIAVIAALSSVALPVLRQSRCQGQETVCASNIRQIGLATAVYSQENETFPQGFCGLQGYGTNPPMGLMGDASYDWQGWWWFDFMADTLGRDASAGRTLWCPSRNILRGESTNHVLCGNYGINTSICRIASLSTKTEFTGKPLKSSNIRSSHSTLLIVDSGYSLISWKSLADDPSQYPFEIPTRQNTYYLPGGEYNRRREIHPDHERDAIEGRHTRKRVNVAYADGHVDKESAPSLQPDFTTEAYSTWSSVKNR